MRTDTQRDLKHLAMPWQPLKMSSSLYRNVFVVICIVLSFLVQLDSCGCVSNMVFQYVLGGEAQTDRTHIKREENITGGLFPFSCKA